MPELSSGGGRSITLVVVDDKGEVLGQMPPFEVDTPWWQDLEPVLAAHPEVVVLRLLTASASGATMGGEVSYLVEAKAGTDTRLEPVSAALEAAAVADDERRAPWARPGGPAADVAWAASQVEVTGPPTQLRSWNLSSIWRLPTADGAVWLKCVPAFFAHEAAVLRALGPQSPVPELIAADGHRLLLAEMPGHDGYGASSRDYREVIDTVLDLQIERRDVVQSLRAEVPAWSFETVAAGVARALDGRAARWPHVARLIDDWPAWSAAVEECGVPWTLFHGDLHPGNARLGIARPIVFDWGDSGYGHPLLDMAVLERYEMDGQAVLRSHWLDRWKHAVPGSDPTRAWALLRPVALARAAAVFRNFLDNIEASEAPYHAADVDPALDAAEAAIVAARS